MPTSQASSSDEELLVDADTMIGGRVEVLGVHNPLLLSGITRGRGRTAPVDTLQGVTPD